MLKKFPVSVPRQSTCLDDIGRLQPRKKQSPVPLTPTQRHWCNERIREHGSAERSLHFSVRIAGSLDVEVLRESLARLVCRHEALRILVHTRDDQLVQDIAPRHSMPAFEVEHLHGADEQVLRRLAGEFLTMRVDFSIGPLFATRLFRLSAEEHVLIVALEHVVTDVISNAILESELWAWYETAALGEPVSMSDPSPQFGDYAVWLEHTREAWLRSHAGHWADRLAGAQPVHLPVFAARYRTPLQEIPFGKSLTGELRVLARGHRVLLSLAVLTVYVAAISRWCRQRDLVIRFESHSRNLPELHRMVGFIASGLYLRVEVSDGDCFVTLLERLTFELRLAYEHQDAGRVLDLLPQLPSAISFNWIGMPAAALQARAQRPFSQRLRIEPYPVNLSFQARQPHFATFIETPSGVIARVHHDTSPAARRAVEHFGHLLQVFASGFVQDPRAAIAQIDAR